MFLNTAVFISSGDTYLADIFCCYQVVLSVCTGQGRLDSVLRKKKRVGCVFIVCIIYVWKTGDVGDSAAKSLATVEHIYNSVCLQHMDVLYMYRLFLIHKRGKVKNDYLQTSSAGGAWWWWWGVVEDIILIFFYISETRR